MSNEKDPIIWQRAWTEERCGMRVVRLRGVEAGNSAFIVERADLDSQRVPQWVETEDEGDRGEAVEEALLAAHVELEELRRRASAREVLPDVRPRELAEALGLVGGGMFSWDQLIAKVRDLAVTDCAPASQAEQMLWQVSEALGIHASTGCTWPGMLDQVREMREGDNASNDERSRMRVADALGLTREEDEAPSWDELLRRVAAKKGNAGGPAFVRCPVRNASARQCVLVDGHDRKYVSCQWEEPPPKNERAHTVRLNLGEAKQDAAHLGQVFRDAVDASELASLRAELTALGKHVEDVERQAYKAETLEAVRSLTDALQALEGKVSECFDRTDNVVRMIGDRCPRTTPDYKTVDRTWGPLALCALARPGSHPIERCRLARGHSGPCEHAPEDMREAVIREHEAGYREASRREVGPVPGYLRTLEDVRLWLGVTAPKLDVYDRVSVAKCVDVLNEEIERQSAREAPLDLATLRVPCAEFPTHHAFISGGELSIECGDARMLSLVLNVANTRLLARALTQWAGAEKGAGK